VFIVHQIQTKETQDGIKH